MRAIPRALEIVMPFEFRVSSIGRYTVKVCDHWIDRWNAKRNCYEVIEFRTRKAAEKAATERLAHYRAMFQS